jgi:hypothetical protein
MGKKFYFLLSVLTAWFLTGCIERPLPQLPQETSPHYWSKSEEAENIDVSDIDANITESSEAPVERKKDGVVKRIPFPTEEYKRVARVDMRGKGVIKGSIYLINDYGEKIYGRNTRLYLNPKTSYSDQWYKESFLGGRKMSKADNRLFNYLRFTSSDANGNFAFYGVPSGTYYLIGSITCAQECGYSEPRTVRLAGLVTIHGKEVIQKDLSANVE